MKFIKGLFIILSITVLGGCGGSDHIKDSVNDGNKIIDTVTVASDGALVYNGSGEFEGFYVNATLPSSFAGKKVYIEKTQIASQNGYTTLSPLFSVRFTEKETNDTPSQVFVSVVTVPYTLSQGATNSTTSFLTIINNAAATQPSSKPSSGLVKADTFIPGIFFAGFLKGDTPPVEQKFIKLYSESYRTVMANGDTFTDPSNTVSPDWTRGITNVQPGELVILGIDEGAFGQNILSVSWEIKDPNNVNIIPNVSGNAAGFTPLGFGKFTVTAKVTATDGITIKTETLQINASGYSYSTQNGGESYCLSKCHDGSLNSSANTDIYGREILRDIKNIWNSSKHASAYNSSVMSANKSECAICHTTGFLFADLNNTGSDIFPTVFGFDDTITNWNNVNSGSSHLKGVTCEACHGPSMTFIDGTLTGRTQFNHPGAASISSGVCLTCHDMGTGVSAHYASFVDSDNKSTHDNSHIINNDPFLVRKEACFKCHTGEGALGVIIGQTTGASVNYNKLKDVHGVTCSVCHDPHGVTAYDAQLRTANNYTFNLSIGTHTTNAKNSKLCYTCHNTDGAGIGSVPHNAQAEILEGVGGYTYGQNLSSSASIHKTIGCTGCHMNTLNANKKMHAMSMFENTSDRLAACALCHTGSLSIQITNGHFDVNGNTAAVRTIMDQLKNKINTLTGITGDINASYNIVGDAELTKALNFAAFNYNLVAADKSYGAHNTKYAKWLLGLSIQDLDRF